MKLDREFFERFNDTKIMVVNCETQEEANSFCGFMNTIGGTNDFDPADWVKYGSDMCYSVNGHHSPQEYYAGRATIIKFSDLAQEGQKHYKTKPIDYTGCHSVIAEHLKRNKSIECWLDEEKTTRGDVTFFDWNSQGEAFFSGDNEYFLKVGYTKEDADNFLKSLDFDYDNGFVHQKYQKNYLKTEKKKMSEEAPIYKNSISDSIAKSLKVNMPLPAVGPMDDQDNYSKPKYKTKPIDYTGCHSVIAEHLKRNESVECWLDKGKTTKGDVTFYDNNNNNPEEAYFSGDAWWEFAEPIEQTQYVKKASEIVKWLEDNGYSVDAKCCWTKEGCTVFLSSMFRYCGHEPFRDWTWLPEWLEYK